MGVVVKIEGNTLNSNKIVKRGTTINRTYEKKRSLLINLYATALDGIPSEGQDIEVLEDTTLLFGGIIKSVQAIPITPSQDNTADLQLVITSDGYNSIPQRRVVSDYYENTDAGTVVNSIITNYLVDEGVSAGTIETGATIEVYNGIYRSLKDILDDMADASGFTWNIDDNKQLNFKAQTTPTSTTKVLDTNDGDHFKFSPTKSLSKFRNKQWVEGGYDSQGNIIRVDVSDQADIDARAIAEGNSGVYGNVYRDSTIQTEADALAVASELLYRYGKPTMATFKSYELNETYEEGEVISVNYPKYNITTDAKYLIVKRTLKRDAQRWVSTYYLEERNATDYTGKTSSDSVDFFSRLVKNAIGGSGSDISLTGRAYDIETAGFTVDTAVVTRNTEFVLPDIADIFTTLTLEYTATSAVVLTLTYKDNDVTDYTFTVNIPVGTDVKTITVPEVEHVSGPVKITTDMSANIAGALTINKYLLRSRWERYRDNYTAPPEPLHDAWVKIMDLPLTANYWLAAINEDYMILTSDNGLTADKFTFATEDYEVGWRPKGDLNLSSYRGYDLGFHNDLFWATQNFRSFDPDTGVINYIGYPTEADNDNGFYHDGYFYFISRVNKKLIRYNITTAAWEVSFSPVWTSANTNLLIIGYHEASGDLIIMDGAFSNFPTDIIRYNVANNTVSEAASGQPYALIDPIVVGDYIVAGAQGVSRIDKFDLVNGGWTTVTSAEDRPEEDYFDHVNKIAWKPIYNVSTDELSLTNVDGSGNYNTGFAIAENVIGAPNWSPALKGNGISPVVKGERIYVVAGTGIITKELWVYYI